MIPTSSERVLVLLLVLHNISSSSSFSVDVSKRSSLAFNNYHQYRPSLCLSKSTSASCCCDDKAAEQDIRAFRSWCDLVSIQAPKLVHEKNKHGIPGVNVRSNESLSANEHAIVVPLDAAILSLGDFVDKEGEKVEKQQYTKSQLPHLMDDKFWTETGHHYRLALLLLDELHKGKQSKVKGYIDHLPPVHGPGQERIDSLVRWNDEELDLLNSPELFDCVAARRKRVDDFFDSFISHSLEEKEEENHDSNNSHDDEIQSTNAKIFTKKEFYWALNCVTTRSFCGNFSGRTGVEDHALIPLIDDLNHALPSDQENFVDNIKEGHDATFISTSPAPMVGEALSFDADSNQFLWTAQESYFEGDEVTQGYFKGVNENFLLSWGFTPFVNEDDKCRVNVENVGFTINHNGKVENAADVIGELRDQSGEDCSEKEAWNMIAKACELKSIRQCNNTTVNKEDIDKNDSISQRRYEVAIDFVKKRSSMLQRGQTYAYRKVKELQKTHN